MNRAMWMVLLEASSHKGPYTITVSLADERASIKDALYGDVWLCSGQSNMEFTVDMVTNFPVHMFLSLAHSEVLSCILRTYLAVPGQEKRKHYYKRAIN